LLPNEKIADRAAVLASLAPLFELPVDTILLGDGDCIFRGAREAWREFVAVVGAR
jgi:hypothetical protein